MPAPDLDPTTFPFICNCKTQGIPESQGCGPRCPCYDCHMKHFVTIDAACCAVYGRVSSLITEHNVRLIFNRRLEFAKLFYAEILPTLLAQPVFICIQGQTIAEVTQAAQVGWTLLANRPLLVVVPIGMTLGAGLRRAADVVLDEWDGNRPECQAALDDALARLAAGG